METGLVTVIVPVYKTEKYLERCIDSIVGQTYPKLEILLIDDGSPDNCPRICEDWAARDDRIRVVHKENAGLGMARNTGIENAQGEYLCFVDSDDYLAPETVEKAYGLASREKPDLVVFGMVNLDAEGAAAGQFAPASEKLCYTGTEARTIFLPDWIDGRHKQAKIRGLCLSACVCLISTALVRKTGWRFVSERELISEDSYALLCLMKDVESVALLPEALYVYCENCNSLTHVYRENRYERIRHFYLAALEAAEEFGENVSKALSGLFLSLTIAAMKQIVAQKIPRRDKMQRLAQIIRDEVLKQALAAVSDRYYGPARKILLRTMERELAGLCCILLAAQIRIKGRIG